MTRRGGSGHDPRQEPDEVPGGETHRVDRVFAPERREPTRQIPTPARTATGDLKDLKDGDLALRRQLSRVERQLAELQRELANKDEELAGELEKQLLAAAEITSLQEQLRATTGRATELAAAAAGLEALEARMRDAVGQAEELAHAVAAERDQRLALEARVDDLTTSLAAERARWTEERAALDAQHAEELANSDLARRVALETAISAHEGDLIRLEEAHREEMARLREAHERSLAALRGELEPRALEAGNLAEERERLASELEAMRAETARAASERDDQHRRELVQLAIAHGDELAAQARQYGAELARITAERDSRAAAAAEAAVSARQREQLWESTVAELRQTQKELQLDLAEHTAARSKLETEKTSAEDRLAQTGRQLETISAEHASLLARAETAEAEIRRNAQERRRFIAYLEEGMAMLGAEPADDERGDHDADT